MATQRSPTIVFYSPSSEMSSIARLSMFTNRLIRLRLCRRLQRPTVRRLLQRNASRRTVPRDFANSAPVASAQHTTYARPTISQAGAVSMVCVGRFNDGRDCTFGAKRDVPWCHLHDPCVQGVQRRREARALGGRNRRRYVPDFTDPPPLATVADYAALIARTLNAVIARQIDRDSAMVLFWGAWQGMNAIERRDGRPLDDDRIEWGRGLEPRAFALLHRIAENSTRGRTRIAPAALKVMDRLGIPVGKCSSTPSHRRSDSRRCRHDEMAASAASAQSVTNPPPGASPMQSPPEDSATDSLRARPAMDIAAFLMVPTTPARSVPVGTRRNRAGPRRSPRPRPSEVCRSAELAHPTA